MTPEQIIAEATRIFADGKPFAHASTEPLLDALECFYMGGTPDDVSGDVEAPTGHFYRVNRWIVRTNSQGFRDILTFDTEFEATGEFQKMINNYIEWAGDED